jgi:hypothetical protein
MARRIRYAELESRTARDRLKTGKTIHWRALAADGKPTLSVGPDGVKIKMAERKEWSSTTSSAIAGLLAWLDPDTLLKRLEAQLDEMPEAPLVLSVKEKEERVTAHGPVSGCPWPSKQRLTVCGRSSQVTPPARQTKAQRDFRGGSLGFFQAFK